MSDGPLTTPLFQEFFFLRELIEYLLERKDFSRINSY